MSFTWREAVAWAVCDLVGASRESLFSSSTWLLPVSLYGGKLMAPLCCAVGTLPCSLLLATAAAAHTSKGADQCYRASSHLVAPFHGRTCSSSALFCLLNLPRCPLLCYTDHLIPSASQAASLAAGAVRGNPLPCSAGWEWTLSMLWLHCVQDTASLYRLFCGGRWQRRWGQEWIMCELGWLMQPAPAVFYSTDVADTQRNTCKVSAGMSTPKVAPPTHMADMNKWQKGQCFL